MKRKNANDEASSSSKRNKKGYSDNEKEVLIDRISNLPDSVLAHILSLLPTKDAVKTLLLRRFGLLWTTSDSLHFDACSFHKCQESHDDDDDDDDDGDDPGYKKRFLSFVHHVLTLHERNPIHRFHLKFEFLMRYSVDEDHLHDPGSQKLIKRELRLANGVNAWTSFAVKREVKVLDLDFLACGGITHAPKTLYKIPAFVFNSDSIRELRLVHCRVEPRGQILMRSLRTLFLQLVALNGNKIEEILSGFPLLENLSLIECFKLHNLNLVSPNLKYLKFVGRYSDSRLEISGPNITSLDISGFVEQLDLKNLCSLKDATLGFKYRCGGNQKHGAVKIIETLSHAKVLTICDKYIMVWVSWASRKILFFSTTWKHVILNMVLSDGLLPGIINVLRTSPCLEILDIHINNLCIYSIIDCLPAGSEFGLGGYWSSFDSAFQGLCNNLRIVRIYGKVTQPYVLQLVQLLLKNLMGLEKMAITSERSKDSNQKSLLTSDELLEFSQKFQNFPRSSTGAEIVFS